MHDVAVTLSGKHIHVRFEVAWVVLVRNSDTMSEMVAAARIPFISAQVCFLT